MRMATASNYAPRLIAHSCKSAPKIQGCRRRIASQLARDGAARADALLRLSHFTKAQIENAIKGLDSATRLGDWLVDSQHWTALRETCTA